MYKNNWFKWYYDSLLYSNKKSYTSFLEIEMEDLLIETDSFKNELIQSVKEIETNSRNILLTNNSMNFAIIKTFQDLGIPVKIWIPRYGSLNLQHFMNSVDFCYKNKFQFEIVDLNVPLFFKNKARDLFSKALPVDLLKLPIIETIEMIGKDLICSLRDPVLVRNSVFYSEDSNWALKVTEDDLCIPAYFSSDKNMHLDFFFGRKELVKSYIDSKEIKDLIEDKLTSVSSSIKIKDEIIKKQFPELEDFLKEKQEQQIEENLTRYAGKLWYQNNPKLFGLDLLYSKDP